ncbi:MAG: UvrD-helicase domain-containing protein, partial [Bacteroidales bacterium]|nr:UvrD-helicase domain-containing protein [Bacteroidales bacterium]
MNELDFKAKIYSASAGSGKTFKLTAECLRLLIKNPNDYKHILAVTFTN